ncbi:SAM-dependent methlyltransferase [Dehalococcoides mccartyi]|jgi:ubiquinone/menaquinone biosynthesis C-methylase UbiE|uniref:SAM-dependent methyltransferase UbiG n=1 Tax=Dehalococcoides mccartyi TaxID=61435 RepID=A0A328ESM2_9CHLR|nr:class I SAM-dependent methyltransferase [Dehalococcoides mccartyi]AGG08368.1 SAM-dependent methyltransferase [Dehalococcoides mccartyi BTF08]AQU06398.1 SAM-dependent methyltransferase [Dehalococcoides mccartyi]AQU07840.1 SAM-dependent methyltransferase [Dehalococcoides mccartyi]AQW62869.1 SAM-dependent methyltransferase [Dehalococcoides mccartyi]AQX75082.1 SAM-dependent methyltransferase [Dehalococcoides mccartyi]
MSSRDYFNQVADNWDEMRQGFFSDRIREAALEAADVKPNSIAADIGAGTGYLTTGLLQKNCRVIAVDQSAAMLEKIKSKFGVRNVSCLQADGNALPLKNQSVDYSFANMFLHHAKDPAGVINEMSRILLPGGRLVITDLCLHTHTNMQKEHHDRWPGFELKDVKGWFEQAGLQNIRVETLNQKCTASSCTCQEQIAIDIFLASGEK